MADTQVIISWTNENNELADTHEIHRSQTSGFTPNSSTKIGEVANDVNEFTDEVPDGTYYYKIKSVNVNNTKTSTQTEVVCSCTAPAQPQQITVSANMFETDADLNNYINDSTNNSTLTTMEDIFNTWPRVTDRTFFPNPTNTDSESAAWTYDSTKNSFVYPNNEALTNLIVSPDKVGDLNITGTLTSDGNDNDGIGIVVAADNFSGNFRFIALWVEPNGETDSVSLRYGYEGNGGTDHFQGMGDVVDGNNFLPTGKWNGKKVKFQITKANDIITAKVSDFDGASVDDTSEVTANINNLPNQGNTLAGSARYGFGVNSQQSTFYENISFASNTQSDNVAYSAESNTKYQYQSTGWANVGTASDDFGGVDIINNNDTGKSFAFDGNTTFTKI